mmetsp:Transcript_146822/g.471383  ORF Transcript_146822/g.471383 Transcript_146822/m.471383 type:complete len:405 (+) Transcript_146822:366-1580(+)
MSQRKRLHALPRRRRARPLLRQRRGHRRRRRRRGAFPAAAAAAHRLPPPAVPGRHRGELQGSLGSAEAEQVATPRSPAHIHAELLGALLVGRQLAMHLPLGLRPALLGAGGHLAAGCCSLQCRDQSRDRDAVLRARLEEVQKQLDVDACCHAAIHKDVREALQVQRLVPQLLGHAREGLGGAPVLDEQPKPHHLQEARRREDPDACGELVGREPAVAVGVHEVKQHLSIPLGKLHRLQRRAEIFLRELATSQLGRSLRAAQARLGALPRRLATTALWLLSLREERAADAEEALPHPVACLLHTQARLGEVQGAHELPAGNTLLALRVDEAKRLASLAIGDLPNLDGGLHKVATIHLDAALQPRGIARRLQRSVPLHQPVPQILKQQHRRNRGQRAGELVERDAW